MLRTVATVLPILCVIEGPPLLAQQPAGRMTPADPAAVSAEMVRHYPPDLLQAGVTGSVRMLAFVHASGETDSVHVVWSSGISAFDRAAMRVAQSVQYAPADSAATPAAGWELLTLHFTTQPAPASAPRLLNRADVRARKHGFRPVELAGRTVEDEVSLLLTVLPTGAVSEAGILAPSCFRTVTSAALDVASELRFEPVNTDSARETAVTVLFAVDSVHIRARGDSLGRAPPGEPSDEGRTGGRNRPPRMTNETFMRRVFADMYPRDLRLSGIGGTTLVRLFLDERGRVRRTRVSRASGHCELDMSAMNIAPLMEFAPAVVNGRRQSAWVEIPIVFSASR
jgi:TonB family protein